MAIYIEMPKLSDTMTEGTLLKWLKKEGDKVESGEEIAEIETDKATMSMEAFDDGILHKHLVAPGSKVAIGAKIALLLQKGEKAPADGEAIPESPRNIAAKADTTAPPAAEKNTKAAATPPTPASGARIKVSPLAKKIAAAKGVELSSLSGTGPGGRIVAKDVEGAGTSNVQRSTPNVQIPAMPAGDGDQRLPLSGMRRIIAERLLASKSTIPHFYLHIEVDAGPLMKARAELNAVIEPSGALPAHHPIVIRPQRYALGAQANYSLLQWLIP